MRTAAISVISSFAGLRPVVSRSNTMNVPVSGSERDRIAGLLQQDLYDDH